MSEPHRKLTHERLLTKNALWNLLGQGLPLVVGVIAIPFLISGMGIQRFGVLTLVWMVIGYFSVFDLGLGRALTKLLADKLGEGREEEIPAITWTALAMMGVMGIAGALVAALSSPWLVHSALKVPTELQDETRRGFYVLALSIPIVISTAGFRGILEAHQRFGLINSVRIPMGLFNFLGPLLALTFSKSMALVVSVLVAGRVVTWGVHVWLCLRTVPSLKRFSIDRSSVRSLLSFGGWMTVSNIISPIMVFMDRFVIGATISMAAVAYYATPYEVITKLWIVPMALVGVLFPAVATGMASDREHTVSLFGRAIEYMIVLLFPITLIVVTLARDGLGIWLGEEFAKNSTSILQWLAVGVLINSVSAVPFAMLQGMGRPDLTAKLHIVEFPLYLGLLWYLLHSYGVFGAAIAWVVRVIVDTALLFYITCFLVPECLPIVRRMFMKMLSVMFLIGLGGIITGLTGKLLFILPVVMIYGFVEGINVLPSKRFRQLRDRLNFFYISNAKE
jgi:O-antigen/teichoic acid export membrane protein